jgi:hypothetical protein
VGIIGMGSLRILGMYGLYEGCSLQVSNTCVE